MMLSYSVWPLLSATRTQLACSALIIMRESLAAIGVGIAFPATGAGAAGNKETGAALGAVAVVSGFAAAGAAGVITVASGSGTTGAAGAMEASGGVFTRG